MKKELSKKSKTDLEKMLSEKQISMKDIRFESAGSKSKDVKAYGKTRKDIARIKTILGGMN